MWKNIPGGNKNSVTRHLTRTRSLKAAFFRYGSNPNFLCNRFHKFELRSGTDSLNETPVVGSKGWNSCPFVLDSLFCRENLVLLDKSLMLFWLVWGYLKSTLYQTKFCLPRLVLAYNCLQSSFVKNEDVDSWLVLSSTEQQSHCITCTNTGGNSPPPI